MKNFGHDNHYFALFCPELSVLFYKKDLELLTLTDNELVYRIRTVLRMRVGDRCVLFDSDHHVACSIQGMNKKEVIVLPLQIEKNNSLNPFIKLYLPLLKRVHLEDAISLAGQVGVSEIQLVTTQKSERTAIKDDRLARIMIGACEQAKQYVVPRIYQPISLGQALDQAPLLGSFVCAKDGAPLSSFENELRSCVQIGSWECAIFVGPEQDFTQDEYTLFAHKGVFPLSLGSLVLQASVAACVAVALLRASFIRKK